MSQKLLKNEKIVAQARANSEGRFLGRRDLDSEVICALIGLKKDADDASNQILGSNAKKDEFLTGKCKSDLCANQ